jgi:cellulose synthase/poly-beta-1,6-N-acetylglucosamine synthase-like glycosyltransferase
LWVLALAGTGRGTVVTAGGMGSRIAVLIPAHNEGPGIARAVAQALRLDYPRERYEVFVVADHCTDDTALRAEAAGALVYRRIVGERGSKGAALSWLFEQVDRDWPGADAVVVFDADTQVDARFLAVVDAYLSIGASVIQGRHQIANPVDGVYPSLHDAMVRIDNRMGNQGRANLGLSAKNMGDSIAYRADVARLYWSEHGLTEDYALRQRLLLEGIRITYAPDALGLGEAPISWADASTQRSRWIKGTLQSSRRYARAMTVEAARRRNLALLDGALQSLLPSYSTLVLMSILGLALSIVARPTPLLVKPLAWVGLLALLGALPVFVLIADRAPLRCFVCLLVGPVFIGWRSALALNARVWRRGVAWQRTRRRLT